MPILNMIYGASSGGGGWQPGANTLARWKLDGDTTDSVNNVYDMNVRVGSISYGTLGDGTTKYGIFNGSTVLVSTSVPTWTKGTLSYWINKSGTSEAVPFCQAIDTNNSNYYVSDSVQQNKIVLWIPGGPDYSWTYTLSTSTWRNLIMTQDGTNLSLYVDGTLIGTTTNSGWFNYNGGNILSLGGQARGTQSYNKLNGYLSNVIIESEARSQSDIQNYYDQTKSLYGIS